MGRERNDKKNNEKKIVVVFSAGSDEYGNPNKETKKRFIEGGVLFLQKNKGTDVIFAKDVPCSIFLEGREGNYLRNINKILSRNGILSQRIKTIPPTLSTAAEINGVICFLKEHPEYKEIYFVSSWYHVPRIIFMWLCRGRWAWPIPVWTGGLVIPLRLLAELPKFVLAITPAGFQDYLVKRAIKKLGMNI